MKMSEYVKGEWKKMRGQPFKVRLAYFWDYYKWHTLILLVIVAAVVYTVVTLSGQKDTVLSGILIGSRSPGQEPALLQEFGAAAGIDSQKQEVTMVTGFSLDDSQPSISLMTYQRIHAGIAAGDTDFITGNSDVIRQCGYDPSHMLTDLRECFSPEELAQMEGKLYYIDGSILQELREGTQEELVYPSALAPEEMEDPIPVGIDLRGCTEFLSTYYSEEQTVYLAIVSNAPNLEVALQFVDFLLS